MSEPENCIAAVGDEFVDILFDFIIVAANLAKKMTKINRKKEGVKKIEVHDQCGAYEAVR